jgi:tRNA 2-thiouridine synthesizing protein C
MVDSVCVLIRRAPYGAENAFAGFRLALATAANGIDTKVVLMEEGVLNAVCDQNSADIGMPSILDAMEDLLSLDVGIYCVEDHLDDLGVVKEVLRKEMNYIPETDLSDLILGCQVMTTF